MRRIVSKDFRMSLTRSGGSIIKVRVDVWKATTTGWEPVTELRFDNALARSEQAQGRLERGEYMCVFQCSVEESLNGVYGFDFAVNETDTFVDRGNVNTTAVKNDLRVFKDQFVLEVREAE
jgi:hypothetical protein